MSKMLLDGRVQEMAAKQSRIDGEALAALVNRAIGDAQLDEASEGRMRSRCASRLRRCPTTRR